MFYQIYSFMGKEGIGRTLRVRILLSKYLVVKGFLILNMRNVYWVRSTMNLNYLRSMYHIEIDLKMNVNLNDKVIYEDFLREYLETQNVIINRCKVIVIKSFELATDHFKNVYHQ